MEYSGAGEKLIHEKKIRIKKSRDTVPSNAETGFLQFKDPGPFKVT